MMLLVGGPMRKVRTLMMDVLRQEVIIRDCLDNTLAGNIKVEETGLSF